MSSTISPTSLPALGLGFQYLADLFDCESNLNDLDLIRTAALAAARLGGVTVVKEVTHEFAPHGISCVLVLAESHMAIHTWPEHNYLALDLFTCSPDIDGPAIIASLEQTFRAGKAEHQLIHRGRPPLPTR